MGHLVVTVSDVHGWITLVVKATYIKKKQGGEHIWTVSKLMIENVFARLHRIGLSIGTVVAV